jgi:predicted phosphodiesterase
MPNQHTGEWTPAQLAQAKKILSKHVSLVDAAKEISKTLKRNVTSTSLEKAITRHLGASYRSFMKPTQPKKLWTEQRLNELITILSRFTTFDSSLFAELSKHFDTNITRSIVDQCLKRAGKGTAATYLKKIHVVHTPAAVDMLPRLVELIKKPITFPELCDKLDMSPKKTQELIARARAEGVLVHVEHNHVALRFPEPIDKIQNTGITPIVGKRQVLGVISDTHLGSKYCLREQLKDCVHYLYERGVRQILHPGDMLDGCYQHAMYEMTHVGIDDQTRDFYETLPALPGLRYHVIGGNHDQTFTDASGVDTPEFIVNYFKKRGRHDITAYGNRGAFIKINGVVVNLWHPRGGGAYAKSYNNQKRCESYAAIKPAVLLTGHFHTFSYIEERGIQAINCPTFQGGQSAFGKSLSKGAPAIGGLLLGWDLTRDGTMRDFALEKRAYFEVERPVNVMNSVDGQPVEIEDAVTESTSRTMRQGRGSKKK